MNIKTFLECERKSMEKFTKFQLPIVFKKIGLGLCIISFIAIIIIGIPPEFHNLKFIAKNLLIVGLLLISMSKEKIEDELIRDLRMQSYTFAFIVAVLYTLAMPFVEYFVDMVFQNKEAGIKDLGDFTILWLMLCSQVGYFHMLKKLHR